MIQITNPGRLPECEKLEGKCLSCKCIFVCDIGDATACHWETRIDGVVKTGATYTITCPWLNCRSTVYPFPLHHHR